MARVTTIQGTKQVKNLGWLLQHTREVESLYIQKAEKQDHNAAYMIVKGFNKFQEPWSYETSWASFQLCVQWCRRPSLRHITPTIE